MILSLCSCLYLSMRMSTVVNQMFCSGFKKGGFPWRGPVIKHLKREDELNRLIPSPRPRLPELTPIWTNCSVVRWRWEPLHLDNLGNKIWHGTWTLRPSVAWWKKCLSQLHQCKLSNIFSVVFCMCKQWIKAIFACLYHSCGAQWCICLRLGSKRK